MNPFPEMESLLIPVEILIKMLEKIPWIALKG